MAFEPPKVTSGYKRQWVKCKICGNVSFYDYVPYSLSIPIMLPPCHHRMNDQEQIKEVEALVVLNPPESTEPSTPTSYIESNVLLSFQIKDYTATNAHLAMLTPFQQRELSELFDAAATYVNAYLRQTHSEQV